MNVTREVISDLWPLYESGEASLATRALVNEFLAGDPAFGRELRAPPLEPVTVPALPEDHEVRALNMLRRQLRGYPWLLHTSMFATALAFGRIVADTSWDVSPRLFIIHSLIAAALWITYLVTLSKRRRRVLIRRR